MVRDQREAAAARQPPRARLETEHLDRAGGGSQQTGGEAQQGGLARAVGAGDQKRLAGAHLEIAVGERPAPLEAATQSVGSDREAAARSSCRQGKLRSAARRKLAHCARCGDACAGHARSMRATQRAIDASMTSVRLTIAAPPAVRSRRLAVGDARRCASTGRPRNPRPARAARIDDGRDAAARSRRARARGDGRCSCCWSIASSTSRSRSAACSSSGIPSCGSSSPSTLGRVPDPRALPLLEELAIDADPRVRRARRVRRGTSAGQGSLDAARSLPPRRRRRGRGLGLPWSGARRCCRSIEWSLDSARCRASSGRPASFPTFIASPPAPDAPPTRRSRSKASPPSTPLAATARAAARWSSRRARRSGRCSRACSPTPTRAVRALAAAGLGPVGTADDLDALRAASGDADLGAAIAAIDAGAAIVRAGRAAPPAAWRATLLERLGDQRPAMRAAAIAAAAAWLLDPELEAALELAARTRRSPAARARAIAALAGARASAAGDLAVEAASDPEPWGPRRGGARRRRARSGRAARSARRRRLALWCANRRSPRRTDLDARPRADLYTRFLADPAAGVRAAVLDRSGAALRWCRSSSILNAFAKDERASPELALAGSGRPARARRVDAHRARVDRRRARRARRGRHLSGAAGGRRCAGVAGPAAPRDRHRDHRSLADRLPQHGGADSTARAGSASRPAAATPSCASTPARRRSSRSRS